MLGRASLLEYKLLAHGAGVVDVRFGETSSMLVALRMLIASSDSCLDVRVKKPFEVTVPCITYLPMSTLRELP